MNKLVLKNGTDSIEFSIVGYEFENLDEPYYYDKTWLMLYGKLKIGSKEVEGKDPCIETTDLKPFAEYIQTILESNDRELHYSFIEPNLSFDVEDNILRIMFVPEDSIHESMAFEEAETMSQEWRFTYFKKNLEQGDLEKIRDWVLQAYNEFPDRS